VFSYCGEASDPAEGAPRPPPRGVYS
jgi:hypothetical protein